MFTRVCSHFCSPLETLAQPKFIILSIISFKYEQSGKIFSITLYIKFSSISLEPTNRKSLSKTSQIVRAILMRVELLLHVSIDTTLGATIN